MILSVLALFAAIESTCVPINCDMYWVTFPDGKADFFVRSDDDPNRLAGSYPWFGIVRPELGMVNISTQASYKGRAREYGFVAGHLRFASEGGKDREIDPSKAPRPTGSARGLWPTQAIFDELLKKHDIWRGGGRLRFISRNPNRTALFLAQLSLVALGVLLFAKTAIWRVHGALWTLIFLVLQFQAMSRGGILAFLAGTALMVYFRFRQQWTLKRVGLLVLGGVLLIGTCLVVYRNRLTQEIHEEGNGQSRTAIWREVPRMLAAAPLGWGLWKSGPAYNAWFEKPERRHMIGDLFNDHLSRIVEGGFAWGGLYVFAWHLVFCAGWRWAKRGRSAVFLAVWAAYFVASSFNPMNYWAKSFWIPGAVSAVWLVQVLRTHGGWRCLSPILPLILTACSLAGLGIVAACAPRQDVPLHVSSLGKRVVVGNGDPQVWVADDGFVLDGNFNGYPGRELRQYYPRHPKAEALGLVERVEDLPQEMDRLVLTGTCGEDYLKLANPPRAKHLIFLTPPFESGKIPESLRRDCDVHLVTGEFVAMRTGDDLKRESWIHVVPGAQVYVPGWLSVAVRERKDEQ